MDYSSHGYGTTPAAVTAALSSLTSNSSASFSPYGSQPWPLWTKYVALMTGFTAGSSSQYSALTVRSWMQQRQRLTRASKKQHRSGY